MPRLLTKYVAVELPVVKMKHASPKRNSMGGRKRDPQRWMGFSKRIIQRVEPIQLTCRVVKVA